MSVLKQRFGRTIREARIQQGWSQEQLAEAANLNRSYLGQIERGEVAVSVVTAEQLASAFDVPLSTLFSRCEQPIRPLPARQAGGDSL